MTTNKDLLLEARRIDYTLRSTFFYRKLNELGLQEFPDEIDTLVQIADNYNWGQRGEWDISETAWNYIQNSELCELRVFSHPRVLVEQPRLIAYYRNIAALSQKAVQSLAFGVKPYEDGYTTTLPQPKSLQLCRLFNAHISAIIDSTVTFSQRDLDSLLFASAGAQIDGSWRNAIGDEAEAVVKRLLVVHFVEAGQVVSFINKDGRTVMPDQVENLVNELANFRGVRLRNQTLILFSSEPDISLRDQAGTLIAVIEVKGGKDPAGALERYGAAKKSFEDSRRENPEVLTVYLASCLTEEVESRLTEDQTVQWVYNLTLLLSNEGARREFLSRIEEILGM